MQRPPQLPGRAAPVSAPSCPPVLPPAAPREAKDPIGVLLSRRTISHPYAHRQYSKDRPGEIGSRATRYLEARKRSAHTTDDGISSAVPQSALARSVPPQDNETLCADTCHASNTGDSRNTDTDENPPPRFQIRAGVFYQWMTSGAPFCSNHRQSSNEWKESTMSSAFSHPRLPENSRHQNNKRNYKEGKREKSGGIQQQERFTNIRPSFVLFRNVSRTKAFPDWFVLWVVGRNKLAQNKRPPQDRKKDSAQINPARPCQHLRLQMGCHSALLKTR